MTTEAVKKKVGRPPKEGGPDPVRSVRMGWEWERAELLDKAHAEYIRDDLGVPDSEVGPNIRGYVEAALKAMNDQEEAYLRARGVSLPWPAVPDAIQ